MKWDILSYLYEFLALYNLPGIPGYSSRGRFRDVELPSFPSPSAISPT